MAPASYDSNYCRYKWKFKAPWQEPSKRSGGKTFRIFMNFQTQYFFMKMGSLELGNCRDHFYRGFILFTQIFMDFLFIIQKFNDNIQKFVNVTKY